MKRFKTQRLGDKGKHSHKWQVGNPSHLKLRKYEWMSHFLLETILPMEVEVYFRSGLEKTRVFYKKTNLPVFFGKTHGFLKKARV